MANKITVEFSSRGGDQLKKKIDDLYISQTRLEKGQKAATRALKKLNQDGTCRPFLFLVQLIKP